MSIEQSLERIATALESIVAKGPSEPPPPSEAKPRGRPKAAPAPVVEEDPLGDGPAVAVTQDQLHAALKGFMDKNGIDKTKALMIKHGAAAQKPVLTSIPAANYAALMAEIGA